LLELIKFIKKVKNPRFFGLKTPFFTLKIPLFYRKTTGLHIKYRKIIFFMKNTYYFTYSLKIEYFFSEEKNL